MELEYLWSTIFILVSSSYIFFQLTKQRKSPENAAKLPPGPPKLPIIWHLHLFSGGGLPQHVLGRVSRRYGPVAHVQLGEMYSVVISSREAAKHVLQTTDPAFADRGDRIATRILWYDGKDLAFCPYGAHWRQMRRICVSELLSAPNLRSFGLVRQDEMSSLVLFLRSRSTSSGTEAVDLAEEISRMTMSVICRATTGSVVKDRDALIGLVKAAASMASGLEVADLFPSSRLLNLLSWNKYRLWRMRRRLDPILEGIVEEHRVKKSGGGEFGGEDIIDVMLRMQKDSQLQVPITTDAIKAFIFDLFTAGAESTSSTATWAMAELMRNPAVMAKAQMEVREALKGKMSVDTSDIAKLKYLRLVVKETLRLHPSIPLIMRQCREECEVNGYTIPVKSRVTVNVRSLGRDPLYWEEPEIFRPERFDVVSRDFIGNDFEYIPFGAGRRICPGMNFGLANVEVPLAQLLYHFDWKLPYGMSPADVDMAEAGGLTGPRKKPLFLVPTPYVPSTE